jgi:uncharacterized protein (DUF952 family)
MTSETAYKILTTGQFAALQDGRFEGAPVDQADGYIHLSTASQLDETLDKHFAGQDGLVIAAVPLAALGTALRWEISRGGQHFPHFYGRLEMRHISAHRPLEHGPGGRALLPG